MPSHVAHIHQPLAAQNVEVRVYVHTWAAPTPRGEGAGGDGTAGAAAAAAAVELLRPHASAIDDEAPTLAKLNATWGVYYDLASARRVHAGRVKLLPEALVRHHLCALESMRRGLALVARARSAADVVVFLRPDLLVTTDLHAARLLRLGPTDVLVPASNGWGGLNDQFAAMSATHAEAYAHRADLAPAYRRNLTASHGRLHPESFLRYALAWHGLTPVLLETLCVQLVRADGHASEEGWHS